MDRLRPVGEISTSSGRVKKGFVEESDERVFNVMRGDFGGKDCTCLRLRSSCGMSRGMRSVRRRLCDCLLPFALALLRPPTMLCPHASP